MMDELKEQVRELCDGAGHNSAAIAAMLFDLAEDYEIDAEDCDE